MKSAGNRAALRRTALDERLGRDAVQGRDVRIEHHAPPRTETIAWQMTVAAAFLIPAIVAALENERNAETVIQSIYVTPAPLGRALTTEAD